MRLVCCGRFIYGDLTSLDLKGKKVAIFGLGDQAGYGDNFCDAMGASQSSAPRLASSMSPHSIRRHYPTLPASAARRPTPTHYTPLTRARARCCAYLLPTVPNLTISRPPHRPPLDSSGELYDLFTAAGATVVGATSTDGYDHADTKSIRDGKFVGMPFDEDNQYDMSEDRAKSWVDQLKGEGMSL